MTGGVLRSSLLGRPQPNPNFGFRRAVVALGLACVGVLAGCRAPSVASAPGPVGSAASASAPASASAQRPVRELPPLDPGAPRLVVTGRDLSKDGVSLGGRGGWTDELYASLRAQREATRGAQREFHGQISVTVTGVTPWNAVVRALHTAYRAGFPNMRVAVGETVVPVEWRPSERPKPVSGDPLGPNADQTEPMPHDGNVVVAMGERETLLESWFDPRSPKKARADGIGDAQAVHAHAPLAAKVREVWDAATSRPPRAGVIVVVVASPDARAVVAAMAAIADAIPNAPLLVSPRGQQLM